MTADARYLEIMTELLSATSEGRARWQAASESKFWIALSKFGLALETVHAGILVSLVDRKGEAIDRILFERGAAQYESVDRLFTLARRQALGIDEALSEILDELSKNKTVGIPF